MELTQQEKERIEAEEKVRFETKKSLMKAECDGGGKGCGCGCHQGTKCGTCGCHHGGFWKGLILGLILAFLFGFVCRAGYHRYCHEDGWGNRSSMEQPAQAPVVEKGK